MFDKNELIKFINVDYVYKKLIVVDQVSPFVVATELTYFTSLFKYAGIDITDHVTYKQDWIQDYEWLFNKMCQTHAQSLVYVTGDLHVGQNHIMTNSYNREIHCLTSSPMSSNLAFKHKNNYRGLLNSLSQSFAGFTYTNGFICQNNFVVVSMNSNKLHVIS